MLQSIGTPIPTNLTSAQTSQVPPAIMKEQEKAENIRTEREKLRREASERREQKKHEPTTIGHHKRLTKSNLTEELPSNRDEPPFKQGWEVAIAFEKVKKELLAKEKAERARIEKEWQEKVQREKEQQEKEESERKEIERLAIEQEKIEKERLEKEILEKDKLEKERLERDKLEKERLEKARLEKEKTDREIQGSGEKERQEQYVPVKNWSPQEVAEWISLLPVSKKYPFTCVFYSSLL